MRLMPIVSLLLLACEVSPEVADPDEGSPRATGGLEEGTPRAAGVLAVANDLDEDQLRDAVPLEARVAANIAAYRAGDDGEVGTEDDERFDSLAELDAVPFVVPLSFRALLEYAMA